MSYPFKTPVKKPAKQKLDFDNLVAHLKGLLSTLPDRRKGINISYSIQDAALSAFSVFFMQCPSFLDYQIRMQETKGNNNVSSLFQVNNIPSDNQIRNLLEWLNRRSQRKSFVWEKFQKYLDSIKFPKARICHKLF